MQENLVQKMVAEVVEKLKDKGISETPKKVESDCACASKTDCRLTEFVGLTTHGHGIGLVIANVDSALHEAMGLDKKYRSIGIVGARTGAGPFIMAADEAVKATNTEVISIELPRDTEGGAGHGSLILFGAEDVSDVKRAVEVAINNVTEKFGDVLFGVSEKKIIKIGSTEGDKNELPNNQKDIHLVEDGIVVSYKGEKVFDVTNNKSYSITITNVDNKPAKFKAQVVDR